MPHTYHQHYFHLIWSTFERKPLIPHSYKPRVFEFIGGAFRTAGCSAIQVGGMPDHIHALVSIPPKFAISEIMRDVKVSSCKWIQTLSSETNGFGWQEGFGSFTVSTSMTNVVCQYIQNQEKHHQNLSFKDEFIELLRKHQITFDEAFLWR
jgi:putative transposase